MKRRFRTRRVLKWVGLVVALLLPLAYVVPGGNECGLHYRQLAAGVGHGAVFVTVCAAADGQGFFYDRSAPSYVPFFKVESSPVVVVPAWIALLLIAVPTAMLWHRDRRRAKGHCQNCGYDLTGNVSGVCPECGEAA